MPRIALIVLSYNRERLIAETLASVAAQDVALTTLARVYLADDCSQDRTRDVARAFWDERAAVQAMPPLEILTPPANVGQWPSANRALHHAAASHDWVLLLHDDDLVKPHWVRLMVDAIHSASARTISICSSWDMLYDDGRIETGEDNLARTPETITGDRTAVGNTVMRGCWWHVSGCAIRTASFLSVGDFDPAFPYSADEEWLLRCLEQEHDFVYLPRTLLFYRAHDSAVSSRAYRMGIDLTEQIRMFARYGRFVSSRDARKFHRRLLTHTARRSAGAVLRRQWANALRVSRVVPAIVASAAGAHRHTRSA